MSEQKNFKSSHHVLYSCKYHVVFCPKYRRKALVGGVDKRLKEIIYQVVKGLRQEFPSLKSRLPTLWTHSYFVSTVGDAPIAILKQYIENQKNV